MNPAVYSVFSFFYKLSPPHSACIAVISYHSLVCVLFQPRSRSWSLAGHEFFSLAPSSALSAITNREQSRLIFSQARDGPIRDFEACEPKWLIQLAALKYKLEPFSCQIFFSFVNLQHQRDITTAQHFILFL
jgi:hypothetical protein